MLTEPDRATKLRKLVKLVHDASNTIINEWEKTPEREPAFHGGVSLPSEPLYNAQRVVEGATGAITELISEPQSRLIQLSGQYFESRALHIAAEHRIAQLLHDHGEQGLHVNEISKAVGIERGKLARILRCLASIHIFRESRPECFANNMISEELVGNEPLRAYIMIYYRNEETAFQLAVGTNLSSWSWMEERLPKTATKVNSQGYPPVKCRPIIATESLRKDDGQLETIPRPELELFGLAMLGGGKVTGTAHLYDYPWQDAADGTVVDVGGGIGGFSLQLSKLYPQMHFVVQDRRAVIQQGQIAWSEQNPDAVEAGRVRFMEHDFFKPQPIKGAEVYWLRYITHDWSDPYCITILSQLASAMATHPYGKGTSRLLIADQVMNTTLGCPSLPSAPDPLPPNYGYHTRYSHQRDLCMLSTINGIERTPEQFRHIIEAAGLRMVKVWQCRSQVSIIECRLPNSGTRMD